MRHFFPHFFQGTLRNNYRRKGTGWGKGKGKGEEGKRGEKGATDWETEEGDGSKENKAKSLKLEGKCTADPRRRNEYHFTFSSDNALCKVG